jgi:hypothetical protein
VWSGRSCPLLLILGLILIPGINDKINFNVNINIKTNGSGQECPLHTGGGMLIFFHSCLRT